jgi:hypothetical protein
MEKATERKDYTVPILLIGVGVVVGYIMATRRLPRMPIKATMLITGALSGIWDWFTRKDEDDPVDSFDEKWETFEPKLHYWAKRIWEIIKKLPGRIITGT